MKLQFKPTTLLLSALAFQLARADLSYYCEMAKDGTNMIQKAYCCDDLRPARYAENFLQGDKCTLLPLFPGAMRKESRKTDGLT